MSTVQPNNSEKLVTLQQAGEKLGVTIETLLSWNEHNILKPTITPTGEVGYAQQQIDQFLIIRQLTQATPQAPTTPSVVPTSLATSIVRENIADVYLKSEKHVAAKGSGISRPSYRFLLSFGALVVLLTIGLFTQPEGFKQLFGQQQKTQGLGEKVLGVQTSKLKLPGQIIASLPIGVTNAANKKTLHDEGAAVSKEKMTVPALYAAKNESTLAQSNRQTQLPFMTTVRTQADGTDRQPSDGALGDTTNSDTFASTAVFKDTCSSCISDADSSIDQRGNIKGDAKTNTIATILGGMGGVVDGDALKPANNDATNQLLFFFIGALAVIYITQQQFAYSRTKAQTTLADGYPPRENPAMQKILEVDQKTDGAVVLYFQGREFKISKPELYSESDRFIERLMELVQPDMKEIEYDILKQENSKLITPLSRLVTRLGFVGVKRDLFFPRTSKHRVLFRRYLTQQDLLDMNLTPNQILADLTMAS